MSDISKSVQRSMAYSRATTEKNKAFAYYNYASTALKLAQIEERGAELGSQTLSSIGNGKIFTTHGNITDREKEIALSFVRYALYGREDQ